MCLTNDIWNPDQVTSSCNDIAFAFNEEASTNPIAENLIARKRYKSIQINQHV